MHDPTRPVYALSCHASYRCRHSGACCTAAWPIPVEADRLARMRAALATGALRVAPAAAGVAPFAAVDPASPDTPALLGLHHGTCVFFDADHARMCAVHRALGHDALPLACRQFPRVSVHEPRGTSVTLSHFCPTAASMLDTSTPVVIVSNAEAFPTEAEYAGLDATTSLPPLLRPDVLLDWPAWWEIERRAVELFARGEPTTVALARLSWAVEAIRVWRPADGELLRSVALAFDAASSRDVSPRPQEEDRSWIEARYAAAIEAIPSELRAHAPGTKLVPQSLGERALAHFIAAHVFANWTAHLAGGLRSWLRSIEIAYAVVVRSQSVSSADLILRHLVDPPRLADISRRAERISATEA